MDAEQIALAEYKEACDICRAHEMHTRTALSFYLAFSGALIAASYTPVITLGGRVWLNFLGLAVGVFVLFIVLRSRANYTAFISRARVLEEKLGMNLYSSAWDSAEASGTFSSKLALAAAVGSICIYFLLSAAYLACSA